MIELLKQYFPLLFMWGATVGLFYLACPLVATALRTGKLLARGAIYDRDESPNMYWFGVVTWIVLCAVFLFASMLLTMGAPKPS